MHIVIPEIIEHSLAPNTFGENEWVPGPDFIARSALPFPTARGGDQGIWSKYIRYAQREFKYRVLLIKPVTLKYTEKSKNVTF